ncbi:TetR/AcrR family transcriptional regulator [Streptomyces albidoflavus]|uniref:TetR/AcrR family transcriptional regulator n=1 Tax=Streptomyces albidoflavus TaxID=1886 RepID=UPI00340397FA
MGRPRTPLIDRPRIATIALELVDANGEFSVPAIARRLGVQTGSLYHHVDGRDGVVELIRERVTQAIDVSTLSAPAWDTALQDWARSYRAAFAAHPKVIPLLTTHPVRAPGMLDQYERVVRVLMDAGFATVDVMPLITALENTVLGSALDLAAPETMWEPADTASTPRLSQALAAIGEGRADAAFEIALAAFMEYAREVLEGYEG